MRNFVAPVVCAIAALGLLACGAEVKVEPPPPPVAVIPPPPVVAVAPPAPLPPPPKKVKRVAVLVGERIKLPGPIVFKTGTADLDPVSDEVLEIVFDYMFEKPNILKMRVEGHTDNVGNPASNQTLSEKRAMSAAHWLVAKGIDCKRIIAVGFGEKKPLVPNTSDDNKAQNRRVDFVNAANKKGPIGGLPIDGGGKVAGDPCK